MVNGLPQSSNNEDKSNGNSALLFYYGIPNAASDDDYSPIHAFKGQLPIPPIDIISTNNYIITSSQRKISIFTFDTPRHIRLTPGPNDTILLSSVTGRVFTTKPKKDTRNSYFSPTSLANPNPGSNLNISWIHQQIYTKKIKKLIRPGYYNSDHITVFHNIFTVCTAEQYIGTKSIQWDICHYSFRFHPRFILEQQKEIISYRKHTTLHNKNSIHEYLFRRDITIEISFFYHTSFLYSTTLLVLFDAILCTNLSRYYCINTRRQSDH